MKKIMLVTKILNKTVLLCLLAWTVAPLSVFAEEALPNEVMLSLYKGETYIMTVGDVERVVVGSGSVISTRLLTTGELVIVADAEGATNIHLWGKSGWQHDTTIYVLPSSTNQAVAEVGALLRNVEGISVKSISGRPVLEGDIYERDKAMVEHVVGLYPGVINLTRVSNAFSEKMVYMNVQITEFSTSDLENLGIAWQTNIAGPTAGYVRTMNSGGLYNTQAGPKFTENLNTLPVSGGDMGTFFGIATSITSRINYLVSTGDAYMLASPRLSARSGGQAEFLAGGQVPVVTSNINGSTVSYKDFGIKLNITPFADTHGNISAKVATEVSAIDNSTAVDGNPGFKTRGTTTDVNMKDGETLVISGLTNSEINRQLDKVKWLGDLPVIGKLFRSKNFQTKKTELVIFVTPTIIDANHAINREEAVRRDDMTNRFNTSFEKGLFE
jgi:pilus assembly protein CpaC